MNNNAVTAYPLCWPAGWKRTQSGLRKKSDFGKVRHNSNGWPHKDSLSVGDATARVLGELGRLYVRRGDMIISSNLRLRLDGLPYADQANPQDPGVAVYWIKSGWKQMKCMAIDRYNRIADNMAAIAATIEAMRAIERHGGAEILERAFLGFQALPEPEQWWQVLGFGNSGITRQDAEDRYRTLAKKLHPDVGGDAGQFARLSSAIEQARRELH